MSTRRARAGPRRLPRRRSFASPSATTDRQCSRRGACAARRSWRWADRTRRRRSCARHSKWRPAPALIPSSRSGCTGRSSAHSCTASRACPQRRKSAGQHAQRRRVDAATTVANGMVDATPLAHILLVAQDGHIRMADLRATGPTSSTLFVSRRFAETGKTSPASRPSDRRRETPSARRVQVSSLPPIRIPLPAFLDRTSRSLVEQSIPQ